jgi:hypothetical protein
MYSEMSDMSVEEVEKVFRTAITEMTVDGILSPSEFAQFNIVITEFLKNEVHN